MAELEWDTRADRPSLRRAVRHRVRELERPCRIVSENFLAAESRMDLLGVGLEGELVSIRIGTGADETDMQLLTRSLSDLAWLRDRTEDLSKLVPDLGIEPSASPRAILLCPTFQGETHRAIESLPAGTIESITYRSYRHQGQLGVVFEPRATSRTLRSERDAESLERDEDHAKTLPRTVPAAQPSHAPAAQASGFRTGLTDADLRPDAGELIDIE